MTADPRIEQARDEMLEGVGAEIAASFPGITRLGGQIVAALYIADAPRTMDDLVALLGRSKSNVFNNLKALQAAGIVSRRREPGTKRDMYALRGPYPDVMVGAYLARLRSVVADYRTLARRGLDMLGDAEGEEAERLRTCLGELRRKYDAFAALMDALPTIDAPVDLEAALTHVTPELMEAFQAMAKSALGER